MGLTLTRTEAPHSALPGGGNPSDDLKYAQWATAIIEDANAKALDRHDWRTDPRLVLGVVEPFAFHQHLFEKTAGPEFFAVANYSHRTRWLAVALKNNPKAMRRIAGEYVAARLADYEDHE